MDAADRQIILDAKTMLCKQSSALFSSLLTWFDEGPFSKSL
ncbi:hypothetical protein [Bartonella apis]